MSLPRLTTFIRAFSGITEPNFEDGNVNLVDKRRSELQRKSKQYKLSWDEFTSIIEQNVPVGVKLRQQKLMKDLKAFSKEIVGDDSNWDLIENVAVYFFITFHNVELITCQQFKEMKLMFGNVVQSVVQKVCDNVRELASILPENIVQALTSNINTTDKSNKFGKGIKVKQISLPEDDTRFFSDEYTSSEDEKDLLSSFKYNINMSAKSEKVENKKSVQKRDVQWLESEIKKYFPSTTAILDLVSSTKLLLVSAKTNVELQNEMFELLGFDRFELIEHLLELRSEFVSQCRAQESMYAMTEIKKSDKKPLFGCQVTVQSESEKEILKQIRREEKKIQRIKTNNDIQEPTFSMDPQFIRLQRENAFQSAINTPLFSSGKHVETIIRYPHVYDSYLEAKQTAGYICGLKMSLPVGFERHNKNEYEEIVIPPSEAPPVNVGNKLKPTAELDEIGRSCFQGIEKLNRIQSVVFDTAYNSNENLLICAPTGAGKTNIAMLTIVHQMKQHIENGMIKKDKFKIIYVAPMKALAAEMVRNFDSRLKSLSISVRELTGDMQLTKNEIANTQIIVTTPEKWDVITRKGTGDVGLTQLVRLLILDEVHLLHGDRGPVVEALVARTLRQVESSQSMIRIVGLSATLPNYTDVAQFLSVNPRLGLFFFDSRFRPVPLGQTFIGVKADNPLLQMQAMDSVCYEKVYDMVSKGHQVMVFVHARNATVRTAKVMREMAANKGQGHVFEIQQKGDAQSQMLKSRNKQLVELFPSGFSVHHAGMLRQDRNLVEKLFRDGMVKVLVCTATLAWGVNLPAHAVVIKGTEIYDAKHGSFVDLSFLDVLQIFGRAGRPQYDKSGHGTIITTHDKLAHYTSLLTCQYPIESKFTDSLTDNLNAEVVLGTVTSVEEAIQWLNYTYLHVRMKKNPQVYGINYHTLRDDPTLKEHLTDLITATARKLDDAKMIRFIPRTGSFHATDLGRTASHYYIKYDTVIVVNEYLKDLMNEGEILGMVTLAEEFNQLKVREDEMDELDIHIQNFCHLPVKGGKENTHGKVNILLQTYISRGRCDSFSLISDQNYIVQNATRITRAIFEVALRRHWPLMAGRLLNFCKLLEKRMWGFENPLRQFPILTFEVLSKIEEKNLTFEKLKEMDAKEIGHMIHHVRMGNIVKNCVDSLPTLKVDASIQPITRNILRVRVMLTADFRWDDRHHGNSAESFWIWVEDPKSNDMHHHEYFMITKRQVLKRETQELVFTIPISEPLPNQYYIRVISDRWVGSEFVTPLSFQHLILPERHPPHTELLDLDPLPLSALGDDKLEPLFSFTHFNPIQTQIFHTLYHTDSNVLIGAPTGSGKTIAAEIAIFRVFREYPGTKVVYIAPLKALVRERIQDWKERLERRLGKTVVEMTGDITPDVKLIGRADVIVTTPEKWDGVSRSWQTRNYVKAVSLIVIDEIHLLGEDRGPVLEVIVSRTNFISSHTDFPLRVIGLSTALANARDLADWLGIKELGLFNFRPSVRPVPLEVHIEGFSGKHYCPRMATMNKPTLQAIKIYSPEKPALIFVSSRRQTRLTALDLIACLASEDNPKQWLHMPENEMADLNVTVKDVNLKLTLAFGIGIHHAGLHEKDRGLVEQLFTEQKIQVLIATATLAWGVNFPAHLVVIKGTEYYDGKTRRYVDFPVTDVLQMMGRAGRPQFDDHGVAVVLVHDLKKNFYRKFLYSPFPVESSLLAVLADHLNAEIVAGTVSTKQDCLDYLTWTYFFRRLLQNPNYYHLEDIDHRSINKFLSGLIETELLKLQDSACIRLFQDGRTLEATAEGRIASYYYLHHSTLKMFKEKMNEDLSVEELITVLSEAHEYEELPVRHNEDMINGDLAKICPLPVNQFTLDSPHTKAHLLFQAHFSRLVLPCSDYGTDLKSVLDQAIRILQAMLDVAADHGWLSTAISVANLLQMVLQGRWVKENSLLMLPNIEHHNLFCFKKFSVPGRKSSPVYCLPQLIEYCRHNFESLATCVRDELDNYQIEQVIKAIKVLPILRVNLSVKGWWAGGRVQEERSVEVQWRDNDEWVSLHADQEYTLNVTMNNFTRRNESYALAPKFPKPKSEGWFLILGDAASRELLALKRVGFVSKTTTHQLSFFTPETTGKVVYTLYVISDCYLGLDQQYDVHMDVIPVSLEAQVNTEVILEE